METDKSGPVSGQDEPHLPRPAAAHPPLPPGGLAPPPLALHPGLPRLPRLEPRYIVLQLLYFRYFTVTMLMFVARGRVMGLYRGGGGLGGLGGGGAAGGGGALCAAAGGWRPRPRRGSHPRHVRHAAAHPHRLGIQVQQ